MAAPAGQRTPLGGNRVTGQLTEWKGSFGWIMPTSPVAHPQARHHGGKVYISQADVEVEIAGVGASVSFLVYSDGNGLGAASVRPAAHGGRPAALTVLQGRPGPYARPPAAAPPGRNGAGHGAGGPAAAPRAMGPGGWAARDGQRQVVSNAKVSGEVTKVSGSTGWISAKEEIRHPQYRGKIYVHQADMLAGARLEVGLDVQFLIYSDSQGLGASQVAVVGADGEVGPASEEAGEVEDEDEEEDPLRKLLGLTEEQVEAASGGAGGGARLPRPAGRPAARPAAVQLPLPAARRQPPVAQPPAAQPPPAQPPAAPADEAGRERVAESVTGEVVDWKGNIGWVVAHEPIQHSEAQRRGGKIYLAKRDVMGEEELPVGQVVQFNVYADSSGLGADDCIPL